MKKLLYVIAATLCLVACEKNTESGSGSSTKGVYVDLGLSSGTKWKISNELNPNNENGFYDYDEAIFLFKKSMPTKEQWIELLNECIWTWTGMGYKVEGSNGNSIILPAAGYCYDGIVYQIGSGGSYWSSSPSNDSKFAWGLYFNSSKVDIGSNYDLCHGRTVRLVR